MSLLRAMSLACWRERVKGKLASWNLLEPLVGREEGGISSACTS